MSETTRQRVQVDLTDFLRVVVVERDKFPTPADAASALGYSGVQSFKAALKRFQNDYPKANIKDYPVANRGRQKATQAEVLATLAALRAPKDEGQDADSGEGETADSE